MRFHYLCFFLFFVFVACEDPVEIPIDPEPSALMELFVGDWDYERAVIDNITMKADLDTMGVMILESDESGTWDRFLDGLQVHIEWDLQREDKFVSIAKYDDPLQSDNKFEIYEIEQVNEDHFILVNELLLTEGIFVGTDPLRYRETITLKRK